MTIDTKSGHVRRHGRGGYKLGCRCDTCVHDQRAYSRAYWREAAPYQGVQPHVNPDSAAAHIARLRAHGMGYVEIARAAGLKHPTIWRIDTGRVIDGIRPDTRDRILGVTPNPFLVPSWPIVRRLRALAALGWTTVALADATGVNARVISSVRAGGQPTITRDIAARLRDAYERLSMTTHDSARTKARAAAAGWAPPLAWDDIDDPGETPATPRDQRAGRADLDEWLHLVRGGESPTRAAERLGVKLDAIEMAFRRGGQADTWNQYNQRTAA